jgi:hypothetical protein
MRLRATTLGMLDWENMMLCSQRPTGKLSCLSHSFGEILEYA